MSTTPVQIQYFSYHICILILRTPEPGQEQGYHDFNLTHNTQHTARNTQHATRSLSSGESTIPFWLHISKARKADEDAPAHHMMIDFKSNNPGQLPVLVECAESVAVLTNRVDGVQAHAHAQSAGRSKGYAILSF